MYKDLTVDAVKDVDEKSGMVTGYFSVFDVKDSDNDIVIHGAFKKTLRENGPESARPRILHLFQHDPYKVISKPTILKEDKHGLYFESKISETSLGKDVLLLYRDKVLTEHSIGYQVVKREVDERQETQKLTELKLWEGSTVSWGANMDALVQTVKSEGAPDQKTWDYLIQKLSALETAIKGSYTDDTARSLEIHFNQIKQLVLSLAVRIVPGQTTQKQEEPKTVTVTADEIISKIKLNIKSLEK